VACQERKSPLCEEYVEKIRLHVEQIVVEKMSTGEYAGDLDVLESGLGELPAPLVGRKVVKNHIVHVSVELKISSAPIHAEVSEQAVPEGTLSENDCLDCKGKCAPTFQHARAFGEDTPQFRDVIDYAEADNEVKRSVRIRKAASVGRDEARIIRVTAGSAPIDAMQFEIVCVNDGSKDDTLAQLVEFAHSDERVRVIDFDAQAQIIERRLARA